MSPNAKKLALRLDSHARRVNLVIPKRASLKKAYEFAEQNQGWIEDKINALPEPVPFINGSSIPIMGKNRLLSITKGNTKVTKIQIGANSIDVTTQLDDPAPRITRTLRKHAEEELYLLSISKAAKLNRNLKTFSVRDMRSRWGSCSTDGRLSLSWRLLFAPMASIDYVISHEIAHLIHGDHGREFWALCEELSTDYATGKEWMRLNGVNLGRYGREV
ncbi:MAG: SprT family zinc-dependent metalloprotease [Pseudomonadota bacterium]